ncbi:MAG: hypothetical protein GXP19_03285 [Gammaproteobacteria bacterium]|nr:hypothetical protein [Gammaproteobacteria bacterium]
MANSNPMGWCKVNDEKKVSLIEKRDELRARLAAIDKDLRHKLDANSSERAIELENVEVLEGIGKATESELRRIEDELAKLS